MIITRSYPWFTSARFADVIPDFQAASGLFLLRSAIKHLDCNFFTIFPVKHGFNLCQITLLRMSVIMLFYCLISLAWLNSNIKNNGMSISSKFHSKKIDARFSCDA